MTIEFGTRVVWEHDRTHWGTVVPLSEGVEHKSSEVNVRWHDGVTASVPEYELEVEG